jgi:hypothetical protein
MSLLTFCRSLLNVDREMHVSTATVAEMERELLRTLQTHKETLSGEVHELHARLRTHLQVYADVC